jgi:hypothetical protein
MDQFAVVPQGMAEQQDGDCGACEDGKCAPRKRESPTYERACQHTQKPRRLDGRVAYDASADAVPIQRGDPMSLDTRVRAVQISFPWPMWSCGGV